MEDESMSDHAPARYPTPAALNTWNRLPTEVKALIIGHLDIHKYDPASEQKANRDALASLCLVSKECQKFSEPFLWREVAFYPHTNEHLAQFLAEIVSTKGNLIRAADFGGAYLRAQFDTASMNRISDRFMLYAAIVEALPSLDSLEVKALPYTNPLVLVTSPSLWSGQSQLRELSISGYPQPLIDGDALALVFDRFPLLTQLSLALVGKNASNAYTVNSFAPSLRRLQYLSHLTLRNVACADERLLEDDSWSAPIRQLVIQECVDLDLDATFRLARLFAPTLQLFDVVAEHFTWPTPADDEVVIAVSPIVLPQLCSLNLEMTSISPAPLLDAIDAVELLDFSVLPIPLDTDPEHVYLDRFVDRHKKLKILTLRLAPALLDVWSRSNIDRLQDLCASRQIRLDWDPVDT